MSVIPHHQHDTSAPQNTFSPNTIKHYLFLYTVNHHSAHQSSHHYIPSAVTLHFPSLPSILSASGLYFFEADIIQPNSVSQPPFDPVVRLAQNPYTFPSSSLYVKCAKITRAILHHRLVHISDEVLDTMRCKQNLTGLPTIPPPRYDCECPVCVLANMMQSRKGKTIGTSHLQSGEVLYMDFAFWDVLSHRGFSAIFMIIDANTRVLWLFFTASKTSSSYSPRFFTNLRRKKRLLARWRSFQINRVLQIHSR
jgi:hypothetical protein